MNFSCIYRIECIDPDVKEIYIGSTENLNNRIIHHKSDCNNKNSPQYNLKVYQYIRRHEGWDNFNVVVEVKTPKHSKQELKELEQIYLDLLEPELNSYNANGLDKENQKEYIKKKMEKSKQIKEICPYCDKEMRKDSINRHIKNKHPTEKTFF